MAGGVAWPEVAGGGSAPRPQQRRCLAPGRGGPRSLRGGRHPEVSGVGGHRDRHRDPPPGSAPLNGAGGRGRAGARWAAPQGPARSPSAGAAPGSERIRSGSGAAQAPPEGQPGSGLLEAGALRCASGQGR